MPDFQVHRDPSDEQAIRLEAQGYCILPDLVPPDLLREIEDTLEPVFAATPCCRGRFYGERTRRFGRLLTKAPASRALVQHPRILAIAERLLGAWCDFVQLNLTQAIEIQPGARAQAPHRDQDMWHGPKGVHEYVLNVMWPLTPFREDNGATVIWPGSHGQAALEPQPAHAPVIAECDPGGAILFLGSTLHHAGANRTSLPRRGIVTGYSLGWLKPYENPFLAYPPAVARQFPPELAALIGYRQHRPNLGNFEGQCPSILLQDQIPAHLAAVDALLPDQVAMIEDHATRQREAGQPGP